MRKTLHLNAAVTLAAAVVLSTAAPAAADSSSCTHHLSGPQVCVRLEGSDVWATPVAIWVNPPKKVASRQVWLSVNGERPRFRNNPAVATRVGKTISYSWGRGQWDPESRICVRFKDIDRVACERIKSINRAAF